MDPNSKYSDGSWYYSGDAFEAFLIGKGLKLRTRNDPAHAPFGNYYVEYFNADIRIHIVSDRGHWSVGITDVFGAAIGHWYGVCAIRQLLMPGSSDHISFIESKEFVMANWQAIADHFSPHRCEETTRKLDEKTIVLNKRLMQALRQRRKPDAGPDSDA